MARLLKRPRHLSSHPRPAGALCFNINYDTPAICFIKMAVVF
jgi:hypothetical protein